MDLRLDYFWNFKWGYINPYFEFLNLFARKNQIGETYSSLDSYQPNVNPSPVYDTSRFMKMNLLGHKFESFPMINIGAELRF